MHPIQAPDETWRRPAPPPALALVQDFVNTNDAEDPYNDLLRTPDLLKAWLVDRELIREDDVVSQHDVIRARTVREGLRELAARNNGGGSDPGAVAALNQLAADIPLSASFRTGGEWELTPGEPGVTGALGSILARVVAAMDAGLWSRVKTCRRDTCRWLFYDHSRNRSGTWCSMAVCGNRTKAETYRRRHVARGPA
jgi:predicted RNA-binding Zn ribbon-like protein